MRPPRQEGHLRGYSPLSWLTIWYLYGHADRRSPAPLDRASDRRSLPPAPRTLRAPRGRRLGAARGVRAEPPDPGRRRRRGAHAPPGRRRRGRRDRRAVAARRHGVAARRGGSPPPRGLRGGRVAACPTSGAPGAPSRSTARSRTTSTRCSTAASSGSACPPPRSPRRTPSTGCGRCSRASRSAARRCSCTRAPRRRTRERPRSPSGGRR